MTDSTPDPDPAPDPDAPEAPADPRPNDEPYFIDPDCPDCGTPLALYDEVSAEDVAEDEIWHDEWTCPRCRDGVHMDWPEAQQEAIFARAIEEYEDVYVTVDASGQHPPDEKL